MLCSIRIIPLRSGLGDGVKSINLGEMFGIECTVSENGCCWGPNGALVMSLVHGFLLGTIWKIAIWHKFSVMFNQLNKSENKIRTCSPFDSLLKKAYFVNLGLTTNQQKHVHGIKIQNWFNLRLNKLSFKVIFSKSGSKK